MKAMTNDYYQKRIQKGHSKIVEAAIVHNHSQYSVAIDCGCGVGNDARYLQEKGYEVHAFDKDERAIALCRENAPVTDKLHWYQASFEDFAYPKAGLVIANSALFFCRESHFYSVWHRIEDALEPGGVFCGDFLGVDDDSNHAKNKTSTKFFTKAQLQQLFTGFDVIGIKERNGLYPTMTGREKHWHAFSVIARKPF
ncbi:class I SAM-dependent methyltransferase [Planctobacterium marinum]|uniref:Tellurite resistance protein n=1 Tax=Planctobacterium marinum TaxID=1631968 RepID=A0AA48HS75_9ALTE|nr:tellurite resistance protein [Planctobacterium marinum]